MASTILAISYRVGTTKSSSPMRLLSLSFLPANTLEPPSNLHSLVEASLNLNISCDTILDTLIETVNKSPYSPSQRK